MDCHVFIIVLPLKEFLRELLKIQVITFSTQKLMTYTEWKGAPSTSLDDYIQTAGIDQAKCKTACLKDVSKICSKDVDGEEILSVFFKCPSWEDTQGPAYYCQQQLEAPEKEDQCAGFTQTSPSIMLLLCIISYFLK